MLCVWHRIRSGTCALRSVALSWKREVLGRQVLPFICREATTVGAGFGFARSPDQSETRAPLPPSSTAGACLAS